MLSRELTPVSLSLAPRLQRPPCRKRSACQRAWGGAVRTDVGVRAQLLESDPCLLQVLPWVCRCSGWWITALFWPWSEAGERGSDRSPWTWPEGALPSGGPTDTAAVLIGADPECDVTVGPREPPAGPPAAHVVRCDAAPGGSGWAPHPCPPQESRSFLWPWCHLSVKMSRVQQIGIRRVTGSAVKQPPL